MSQDEYAKKRKHEIDEKCDKYEEENRKKATPEKKYEVSIHSYWMSGMFNEFAKLETDDIEEVFNWIRVNDKHYRSFARFQIARKGPFR